MLHFLAVDLLYLSTMWPHLLMQIFFTQAVSASPCSMPCSSYVGTASASSQRVCLNSAQGICGNNQPCPSQYPECAQVFPPTPVGLPCETQLGIGELNVQEGITWGISVYGKYYADGCDSLANSLSVFYNASLPPSKTVIEIHGGGFVGGSRATSITGKVRAYVNKGFTYISLDYRLVNKKYYFTSGTSRLEEEFIVVDREGRFSIPSTQQTMKAVKTGRLEHITKCVYDAKIAMDFIVANAAELRVDPDLVSFIASSAGGAEANYLTWSYPRLYPGKITPRALAMTNEQLDYPVQSTLEPVWSLFQQELGSEALLQDLLDLQSCASTIGNPMCGKVVEQDICNQTWHDETVARFCSPDTYSTVTLSDLIQAQQWVESTEQDRGVAYLWKTTKQIELAINKKNVWLYVSNSQGGAGDRSGSALVHHSIYSKLYGDLCLQHEIKCAVYYAAWTGIDSSSRGQQELQGKEYRETFGWQSLLVDASSAASATKIPPDSEQERVEFLLAAMNSSDINDNEGEISANPTAASPSPMGPVLSSSLRHDNPSCSHLLPVFLVALCLTRRQPLCFA